MATYDRGPAAHQSSGLILPRVLFSNESRAKASNCLGAYQLTKVVAYYLRERV